MASKVTQIQYPLLFPCAEILTRDDLWMGGACWATDPMNRSTTTADPDRAIPYEMWLGQTLPLTMLPCLNPRFCRVKQRWENQSRVAKGFSTLELLMFTLSDALRVLGHP